MMLSPFILEQLLNELQGGGSSAHCPRWCTHSQLPVIADPALGRLRFACAHSQLRPGRPLLPPARHGCTRPHAGLVAFGLATALAAGSLTETLLVNAYFHILFRMCAHLKVS